MEKRALMATGFFISAGVGISTSLCKNRPKSPDISWRIFLPLGSRGIGSSILIPFETDIRRRGNSKEWKNLCHCKTAADENAWRAIRKSGLNLRLSAFQHYSRFLSFYSCTPAEQNNCFLWEFKWEEQFLQGNQQMCTSDSCAGILIIRILPGQHQEVWGKHPENNQDVLLSLLSCFIN